MNQRNISWLYGELPRLVQAGVLSEDAAEGIRRHYGPAKRVPLTRLALVMCSVLGAALIGGGIILLLAHNWEGFGRPLRTVMSLLPLAVGQFLVGYTVWRKPDSTAWREGSSTFLALAIGASIALIGQTYHLPGEFTRFLFVWLVLGLPLLYLLRSAAAMLLYQAGTLGWAAAAQGEGGHALWYWFFIAALLPMLWSEYKLHRTAPATLALGWALCLNLSAGLGIALEKVLPGLWIVAYAGLMTCFYLLGRGAYRDTPGQPFSVIGSAGTVILGLLFTLDFGWKNIGFGHYRNDGYHHVWVGAQDYLLTLALLGTAAWLAVRAFARKDMGALPWGVFPALACVCYAIANAEAGEAIPLFVFNVYLFALGVLTLRGGVGEGRLAVANGGLAILGLLLTFRFFDSDLSFVSRAIAFIVLGMGFLGANFWLSRRLARNEKELAS